MSIIFIRGKYFWAYQNNIRFKSQPRAFLCQQFFRLENRIWLHFWSFCHSWAAPAILYDYWTPPIPWSDPHWHQLPWKNRSKLVRDSSLVSNSWYHITNGRALLLKIPWSPILFIFFESIALWCSFSFDVAFAVSHFMLFSHFTITFFILLLFCLLCFFSFVFCV